MHLADHIRPLLRDHDCVIIPDFGGLVADVSPARAQPGRQALSPPTKLVAFNQALTRNDGLLVDALSQHLGLPIAEARERVRVAVAGLHQELDENNRTELPGIGIFRRAAGRGLAFEYTGTDNLLASSFGLPELAARPVRAGESRQLPKPALRGVRRTRLARFVPAGIIAVAVGLLLLANYQAALKAGYLPTALRPSVPKWEWAQRHAETPAALAEPQQAALGQHDFGDAAPESSEGLTPISAAPAVVPEMAANELIGTPARNVPVVRTETGTAPLPAGSRVAAVAAKSDEAVVPANMGEPAPVAPAVATAPRKAAIAISHTIKTPMGRFYVIAGTYSNIAGAEVGRRNLLHAGHVAQIILPHFGTRYFRLTAGTFADQASAQREAQRLRLSTRSEYYTLKY